MCPSIIRLLCSSGQGDSQVVMQCSYISTIYSTAHERKQVHSKKGIVTWTYFLSFEMRHNNKSCCSICYMITSVAWTPTHAPKHTIEVPLLHTPLSWTFNNSILSYASITGFHCTSELQGQVEMFHDHPVNSSILILYHLRSLTITK